MKQGRAALKELTENGAAARVRLRAKGPIEGRMDNGCGSCLQWNIVFCA